MDVEKERSETEALAGYFKTKIEFESTQTKVNHIPAAWITTPGASRERVILFFHGGGYNSGSIKSHRPLAANIGNASKARVLLVDYRLAPEHLFPAAVEDAESAYGWLLSNEISPDQIIVAGDSAGGGLAISLLIRLRDAGESLPAAAVCLSPWMDLTCSGESWRTNTGKDLMLDPGAIMESARLYLGETDPRTPLASPLYADLSGLPPILIQVGSDEFLLSDSTNFTEQAQAAGVKLTLEVWEGMQHEWHFAARMIPEGRQAIGRIGEFILSHTKK